MIFDKKTQQIEFTVYDEDIVSDEFLGRAIFHLDTLQNNVSNELINLDLLEIETGTLQISCLYTSLGDDVSVEKNNNMDDISDILFNMTPEMLKTDILLDDSKSISNSSSANRFNADDEKHQHTTFGSLVAAKITAHNLSRQSSAISVYYNFSAIC